MATTTLTPDASMLAPVIRLDSTALDATTNQTVRVENTNLFTKVIITTVAASLDVADSDLTIYGETLNSSGSVVTTTAGTDRYGNALTEANKANGAVVWELINPAYDQLNFDWAAGTNTTGTIQIYVSLVRG